MLLAPLIPSEIKKGRVDAINPGHIPVLSIRRSHFPGRLSQKERNRIEYERKGYAPWSRARIGIFLAIAIRTTLGLILSGGRYVV